jgi:hypothetical protein
MLSESILKNLCSELGFISSSVTDACHVLNIRVALDEHGKAEVQIPNTLLSNDYVARGRLCKEIEDSFNDKQMAIQKIPQEKERIVFSYPYHVRPLVLSLIRVLSEVENRNHESDRNFLHNARWLLVPVKAKDEGWHPADLRTLYSSQWTAEEMIQFMKSKPVKYIMYHNAQVIRCLDLDNNEYLYRKAESS